MEEDLRSSSGPVRGGEERSCRDVGRGGDMGKGGVEKAAEAVEAGMEGAGGGATAMDEEVGGVR